jgi:hypothetical protein
MPLAVLYFFFNSLFLPEGLLYTAILTPFFLWWLYREKSLRLAAWFFAFTLPFILLHVHYGVETGYYLRSYLLLFSSVVFALGFHIFLKKAQRLDEMFRHLLALNFLMLLVALFALWIPALKNVFWYLKEFSPGINGLPRLKMLTYEPSYYSLLFAPLALYFYMRLLLFDYRRYWLVVFMVTLPLVLSLSLGVLSALLITFVCLTAYRPALVFHRKNNMWFIVSAIAVLMIIAALYDVYDPSNPVFGRIKNIFSGDDTSFRGRTYESFVLAWRIAREKSVLFGCGLGQAKIIGVKVFKDYYGYLPPVVRIPNTLADTMATFGLTGLVLRLAATVFLFFRTRVSTNYYRLALFIFIFIYQFTGSFLNNIVEYVLWVMAFTPAFPQFNREQLLKKIKWRPAQVPAPKTSEHENSHHRHERDTEQVRRI